MPSAPETITLTVTADPRFARLVRMTASNVAMLSSMSVDRVEDVRMAAEEAFIYACSAQPAGPLEVVFTVDDEHVALAFTLTCASFSASGDDETAAYADLILAAVADRYEKTEGPATIHLDLRADV